MSKLILYLNRQLFQTMEFELLDYDSSLSFELNSKLREQMIDYQVRELKAMYYKQINKVGNYKIILVHESEINSGIKKRKILNTEYI